MAVINTRFLFTLEQSVLAATKELGISTKNPRGTTFADVEAQTMALHDASVELLRGIESLQNWAADVTRALQELGIDVDNG